MMGRRGYDAPFPHRFSGRRAAADCGRSRRLAALLRRCTQLTCAAACAQSFIPAEPGEVLRGAPRSRPAGSARRQLCVSVRRLKRAFRRARRAATCPRSFVWWSCSGARHPAAHRRRGSLVVAPHALADAAVAVALHAAAATRLAACTLRATTPAPRARSTRWAPSCAAVASRCQRAPDALVARSSSSWRAWCGTRRGHAPGRRVSTSATPTRSATGSRHDAAVAQQPL